MEVVLGKVMERRGKERRRGVAAERKEGGDGVLGLGGKRLPCVSFYRGGRSRWRRGGGSGVSFFGVGDVLEARGCVEDG